MKNEITIFESKEFGKVRTTVIDGKPWFVATDIASALGYEKPNNAVNVHCKKLNKFSYPETGQPLNIIPESDLYRMVMRSQLESAERFQDWVVEEVLPSIRKTGSYSMATDEYLKDFNLHEIADQFEASKKLAGLLGLDANQQIHSANTMVRRLSGFDCMLEFNVTAIEYKENVQYLTATELGALKGLSGKAMNRLLEEKGLQKETRNHKKALVWVVTDKGKDFSRMFDTKKQHTDGSPIMQVKWAESVLSI